MTKAKITYSAPSIVIEIGREELCYLIDITRNSRYLSPDLETQQEYDIRCSIFDALQPIVEELENDRK